MKDTLESVPLMYQTTCKKFQVTGTVIHEARSEAITLLDEKEIRSLNKDVLVFCEGANDINKNETNMGLQCSWNFVLNRKHTNVLAMTAPHRHHLHESSCTDTEILIFNPKVR